MLKGKCKNCRYETQDLYFGGGFMNHMTCCDFPCIEKVKKVIIMENIFEKEKVCSQHPNITFYDDKSLMDKTLQDCDSYIDWDMYKLFHDGYYCPNCNHFSLGFLNLGCWD